MKCTHVRIVAHMHLDAGFEVLHEREHKLTLFSLDRDVMQGLGRWDMQLALMLKQLVLYRHM